MREDGQRSLEAGLRTSEATGGQDEYLRGTPELTPEHATYLQQRGIIQIPQGRWMEVTNIQGEGYNMTPVELAAVLARALALPARS